MTSFDVLGEVESQAAVLLRDRVAEQAKLRRGRPQVGGDLVGLHDLGLARHGPEADEVAGDAEDLERSPPLLTWEAVTCEVGVIALT